MVDPFQRNEGYEGVRIPRSDVYRSECWKEQVDLSLEPGGATSRLTGVLYLRMRTEECAVIICSCIGVDCAGCTIVRYISFVHRSRSVHRSQRSITEALVSITVAPVSISVALV